MDAPRVLIAGYGLTGEHLARVLAATGVEHRVLDTDPHRVKRERAAGVPIVLADASRADALVQRQLLREVLPPPRNLPHAPARTCARW